MSRQGKTPAEAVEELRAEWRRVKADPAHDADELHAIEVLGRAAALINDELTLE